MNKETGGPAYPSPRWEGWGSPQEGMTLRDYFAAKAMQAVITDWLNTGDIFQDAEIPEVIARDCYLVADAMLEARNQ
jgi:hypothetical protein